MKTQIDKETILKYEMKHLSKAYRTNYNKMKDLLHDDFFEVGLSGKSYNKESILSAIPLEVYTFEIQGLSFEIDEDVVITHYTLIKNRKEARLCESKWVNTPTGLKLAYFESSKK